MARLSRKLRLCKWIGTAGCALIVGAWFFSAYWRVDYQDRRFEGREFIQVVVILERAQFGVVRQVEDYTTFKPDWPLRPGSKWRIGELAEFGQWDWRVGHAWPEFRSQSFPYVSEGSYRVSHK